MSESTNPAITLEDKPSGILVLNTRTLVMAVVALVGGGLGGTGIMVARPDHDAQILARIDVRLERIDAAMQSSREAQQRIDQQLADHEQRLRVLEKSPR